MTAGDGTTARLVSAAQSGDPQAREELFARYLPRVARMVAARVGLSRSDLSAEAEDTAQDAMIRAMGSLDRFEMRTPGAFAHWMECIVLNCVRQRFRRVRTKPEQTLWQRYGDFDLSESFFGSAAPTPSSIIRSRERNEAVEAALLELPQLYRRALVARYIGEMSYEELARHLERRADNCRKIVERALQMLRARLAERDL